MDDFSAWQQLGDETFNSSFLERHLFSEDGGYVIQISDLCSLWEERLEKADILTRSEEDHCSINPAEDTSQLTMLLQEIEKGISQAKLINNLNCSARSRDKLVLTFETTLPSPLAPLRWMFTLQLQNHRRFSEAIVIPLLNSHGTHETQSDRLIRVIEEKDSAIGKILDKVEAKEIDLAMFLPPSAPRSIHKKPIKKAELFRVEKGLQPFEKSWWKELNTQDEPADTVFRMRSSVNLDSFRYSKGRSSSTPELKLPVSVSVAPANDDETTEDEIEDDGSQQEPIAPPPASPPPQVRRKLGIIGGMQPTVAQDQTTTSVGTPPRRKLGVIGGAKTQSKEAPPVASEPEEICVPETQHQELHVNSRRSPISAQTEDKTPDRESSVDRAARKREDLKRALDAKAKANSSAGKKRRL